MGGKDLAHGFFPSLWARNEKSGTPHVAGETEASASKLPSPLSHSCPQPTDVFDLLLIVTGTPMCVLCQPLQSASQLSLQIFTAQASHGGAPCNYSRH